MTSHKQTSKIPNIRFYLHFLHSGLWEWWAKPAYQAMLTIRARLITPFIRGSMSVDLNVLIRHSLLLPVCFFFFFFVFFCMSFIPFSNLPSYIRCKIKVKKNCLWKQRTYKITKIVSQGMEATDLLVLEGIYLSTASCMKEVIKLKFS